MAQPPRRLVIVAIAAFKIVKAVLLVALGVGLLRGQDGLVGGLVHLAHRLHVDPDGRHLGRALQTVAALNGGRLQAIKVAVFIYAAVFLTEGTGLFLGRRSAE